MKKFWDSACDLNPGYLELNGWWCPAITDSEQFNLCYDSWESKAMSLEVSDIKIPEESFMLLCFMSYIYDGE